MGNDFEVLIDEISRINNLDGRQIHSRFIKFNEEFGEFSAEVIKMLGESPKPYDEEHLIEESADALQCLLSIILHVCKTKNIDFQTILNEMFSKNIKWEHSINNFTENL